LSIEEKIIYRFKDKSLLEVALTHASVAGEKPTSRNNEKLEFLGDRVLGLAIADWLYGHYGAENEGDLAKRLTALVQQAALVKVANDIDLAKHLHLAAGERGAGGQVSDAIVADALEALIGAIFLEAGYTVAQKSIMHLWKELLNNQPAPPEDSKTALQEWVQARGLPLPAYAATGQSGPAHAPMFTIELTVKGYDPVTATAASKRAAEKEAARLMLLKLKENT
jgi:ribonuclease-3